ncbi:MAG: hypothetical protein A3J65_04295 [Candidatus Buchananbacteria bacterium RIFCSPHIGHO2_02_FULL_45_11b]|uniref:Uncharacterized protein n=4 Tax=Candidatus Buchananiibacteriota TaxID=1817903 RepID=A0A1G1YMU2_9BACT|nr:MAG: hypothetical protein A2663_00885 [Candidatus Buchananbacteria bacterium RIFCSPHIGHO2_01_FULL_46_12]OGY50085.1 MAG: hypothetical protein A3J65_04295 [Candidatus Buchananbacteria bacterium RIFCSPHIGHO2_02_FULL_45_11b]OGY53675.1 MAG: hypothetical protein A3B15_01970 [Candidatus Buchananbacteria bacterium RIFCSPLOWO2_01_FULL_45_31]OGY56228.1 MAG: hypothetical protein A3H67_03935 [Candidatus Buchananbacteria bacterium RIFCSPLOWO2_02_FULL_46_11b]
MTAGSGLQNFKDVIAQKKPAVKPPAYPWQEMALKIIAELNIPPQKRNSVFLVCKKNPKAYVEKCLNDTKELCKTGERWKYFFKLIEKK